MSTASYTHTRHFAKMTAPDLPMEGAIAALHQAEGIGRADKSRFAALVAPCAHQVGHCHFHKTNYRWCPQ